MDFGKYDLQRKVLKLKHRDGLTLKQAWAQVKGGRGSPSRRRRRSGRAPASEKQKRQREMAAKAMRLYKSGKAASLSDAWAQVKGGQGGFGSFLKSMFGTWSGPCPEDEENSPKTGKCVKKCKSYQTRSPTSGRCVGREPDEWKLFRGPCPRGKMNSPKTGRCIKIRDDSDTSSVSSVSSSSSGGERLRWSSETAKKLAYKNGLNLEKVSSAIGKDGSMTINDVKSAIEMLGIQPKQRSIRKCKDREVRDPRTGYCRRLDTKSSEGRDIAAKYAARIQARRRGLLARRSAIPIDDRVALDQTVPLLPTSPSIPLYTQRRAGFGNCKLCNLKKGTGRMKFGKSSFGACKSCAIMAGKL